MKSAFMVCTSLCFANQTLYSYTETLHYAYTEWDSQSAFSLNKKLAINFCKVENSIQAKSFTF